MSVLMDQIARTFWVDWWAREHEERANREEDYEVPWGPGAELFGEAPETPAEAYIDAGRFVGMLEGANRIQLDAAWARALKLDGRDWEKLRDFDREDSKKEFGYAIAMEGLGTGVAWADDHEDHGLKVPQIELEYMPEVFGGEPCAECGGETGGSKKVCANCGERMCVKCRERICWDCRTERV